MRKLTAVFVTLAILLTMTSLPVLAAESPAPTEKDTKIEFEEGQFIIPEKPEDIDKEDLDDDEKDKIDDIFTKIKPSEIDFGAHKVKGVTRVIDKNGTEDVFTGLRVLDNRGLAENSKWSVSVGLGSFQETVSTQDSLKRATLYLEYVTDSIQGTTAEAYKPTASSLVASESSTGLVSGDTTTHKILEAGSEGSPGLWGANWKAALKVEGGTEQVGNHTAVLTWTLEGNRPE